MVKGIYIHIPFCLNKCNYCDFLSFKSKDIDRKKYVEYLKKEIKLYPQYEYNSVYFGGGTPSLLEPKDIKEILDLLIIKDEAEVTIEVNPKTVDYDKFKGYKKAGINRVSIGIQSFDREKLKVLGRMHNEEEGKKAYEEARRAGFKNISLDLMFSLPNQKLSEVRSDLKELFKLKPEHFSIYSLIWEEGTNFFEKLKRGEMKETDNDLEADMYNEIIEAAKKEGYIHYEISNFSLPGREAIHNSSYWRNEEYLGIGLGASGYCDGIRYKNQVKFKDYYDNIDNGEKPILESEIIDEEAKNIYKYILGLRLLEEGVLPEKKFIEICKKLEKIGLLEKKAERYILTKQGIFLANDVFDEFV
ncbi:MAG: radical SAM family heme chaperone HemW [Cetobacterium sp.]|uniref:radical SAM family heme chaperone HemW n=1 Tax=Cetobacterium sp. TaxID=2071632 RepID=UPI003F2F132E